MPAVTIFQEVLSIQAVLLTRLYTVVYVIASFSPNPIPRAKLFQQSWWGVGGEAIRKRPTLTISLNDVWELKTSKHS